MNNFKVVDVDLGTATPGATRMVEFPYENIKTITSMSASCGCSLPKNDKQNSMVVVKYVVQDIPAHLASSGYKVTKKVTVNFIPSDDPVVSLTQELQFSIKVLPKK